MALSNDDLNFIIYYLNYPKAIELCMTMDNVVRKSSSVETTADASDTLKTELKGDASTNLAALKTTVGASLGTTLSDSESFKVADTYEVKHTKSTYLKLILERAKMLPSYANIQNCAPGDLVRVDGVRLWPCNWEEITQMQVLRHDALKGMRVEGVDVNNIVSSMLEDYAYVLTAMEKLPGTDDPVWLAIKIPSENDNEFESKYRMRDLLLGEVSLIGVYKGLVDVDVLTNTTFGDLQRKGLSQGAEGEGRVIKSALPAPESKQPAKEASQGFLGPVHYIDLIAIVQDVKVADSVGEDLAADELAGRGTSVAGGSPDDAGVVLSDSGEAKPCFFARLKAMLCG